MYIFTTKYEPDVCLRNKIQIRRRETSCTSIEYKVLPKDVGSSSEDEYCLNDHQSKYNKTAGESNICNQLYVHWSIDRRQTSKYLLGAELPIGCWLRNITKPGASSTKRLPLVLQTKY